MKTLSTLLLSVFLTAGAMAGSTYVASSGKGVVTTPPPPELCFGPGFSVGIFAGGFLPRHTFDEYDDALGGGALAEYFFDEHFGIQVSYGAFATSATQHLIMGDLVVRFPFHDICVAPYILVGGGAQLDSTNYGIFHAGAGIEFKFSRGDGPSIFADGTYNWHGSDSRDLDFTLVRAGVKFRL